MINKDYLDHLKKTDPMAYYDLTQDPMVVGEDTDYGCGCILALIVFILCCMLLIIILC
jgi:hypothetical protein